MAKIRNSIAFPLAIISGILLLVGGFSNSGKLWKDIEEYAKEYAPESSQNIISYVILFLVFAFTAMSRADVVQSGPILIESADSNATALDVNQTSWGAAKDWVEISERASNLSVKFYVYDPCGPNDATFSYEFYVADYGCNAAKVAAGDATCGALQLSRNPVTLDELNDGDPNSLYCWVDTLGTVTADWASTVYTQNDGGLNDISAFIFNCENAKTAWCRIYDRSSATMVVYCVSYYFQ